MWLVRARRLRKVIGRASGVDSKPALSVVADGEYPSATLIVTAILSTTCVATCAGSAARSHTEYTMLAVHDLVLPSNSAAVSGADMRC